MTRSIFALLPASYKHVSMWWWRRWGEEKPREYAKIITVEGEAEQILTETKFLKVFGCEVLKPLLDVLFENLWACQVWESLCLIFKLSEHEKFCRQLASTMMNSKQISCRPLKMSHRPIKCRSSKQLNFYGCKCRIQKHKSKFYLHLSSLWLQVHTRNFLQWF